MQSNQPVLPRTHTDEEIMESWGHALYYSANPPTAARAILAWFDAAQAFGGLRRYSEKLRTRFAFVCGCLYLENMLRDYYNNSDAKTAEDRVRLMTRLRHASEAARVSA